MEENHAKLASLIAGCLKQDEYSQLSLYRHYYSYGMAICLRYTSNRESALEVLNDGFLKVFKKIAQYNPDQPFKPWLRKIMINASIDHFRRYEQKDVRSSEEIYSGVTDSDYNTALDQLEFEDLLQLTQLLSPAYRVVFNLFVVEGLPHDEIAKKLGISIGSSKSNLSKARGKIKELLKQFHNIHFKPEKYG